MCDFFVCLFYLVEPCGIEFSFHIAYVIRFSLPKNGWMKMTFYFFFFSIVRNLIYEVIISIKSTECIE